MIIAFATKGQSGLYDSGEGQSIFALTLASSPYLSLSPGLVSCAPSFFFNMSIVQYFTILYNTLQYFTILYNTLQYFTILYNTLQYFTIRYNCKFRCSKSPCNTLYNFPNPVSRLNVLDVLSISSDPQCGEMTACNRAVPPPPL